MKYTFKEALNEAKELSEATRKDIRQLEGVLSDIGVNFKTNFTPSLTRIVANTPSEDITYEYDNRSIAFYVDGKQVKKVATKNIDWAEDEMRGWITSNHTY